MSFCPDFVSGLDHQIAIVKRYLTNNPRLEDSKDLLHSTKKLPNIKKESFEEALNIWHIKYKSFLEESKQWKIYSNSSSIIISI